MEIRRNNSGRTGTRNIPIAALGVRAPQQPTQRAPQQPPAPPAPVPIDRAWLAAWAQDFSLLLAKETDEAALPLTAQHAAGITRNGSAFTIPSEGFYMLLWELGVDDVAGEATLQLGLDQQEITLSHALRPGYDAGQQVTWLSAGVSLRLFARAAQPATKIDANRAQLNIIRLG
ncbi:MAG: hypothetical protein LBB50_02790 [Oscillospiraceae bacterium]|nr:hypothetical protein [Oscillospiraceae bacterium]